MTGVGVRYFEAFRADYDELAPELERAGLPRMPRDAYETMRQLFRVKHGYSKRVESVVMGGYQGLFLYGFVRVLRPATVIDVGTCWGFSALCAALALLDGGVDGVVLSVDPAVHDDYGRHPRFDALRAGYVVELTGRSQAILPRVVGEAVECALVDGSHRYFDVRADVFLLGGRLSERGVVLVDDCAAPYDGVMRAVAQAEQELGLHVDRFGRLACLSRSGVGTLHA